MLLFCVLEGITQLFMVVPYWKFFSIDGHLHKDIRPTILIFFLYLVVVGVYTLVYSTDWALKWLPIAMFPPLYIAAIAAFVALWFFTNLFLLRTGSLNFITDIADRWYKKKVDKINHTNMLSDQGIESDPFGDFTNKIKDANLKFKTNQRDRDGKDKD